MIEIVPLTEDHCARMAREMRAADRAEMSAMTGDPDTFEARRAGLVALMGRSQGRARAGLYGGDLVNIWGVMTRTTLARVGHPWMVTTDLAELRAVRRAMAHRCRAAFLDSIPPHISGMWNLVDMRNEAAIQWLRWLNFRFDETPIDHGGARWLRFEMEGSLI